MKIERQLQHASGTRFSISNGKTEIARAYLYVLSNDLHTEPFGLLEDVFVDESQRAAGIGTKLVREVIQAAKDAGCYKLIATSRASRPKVHALYERLGFRSYGVEFRMDIGS